MVGTPPYQKRGKCGHWMPAFDKHLRCYSCRMHCKGDDPCASEAPLEACSACSALTEVEWNHLWTVFHERSAKRASKNLPADPEPEDEDPEAGEIDDSILDLNTEDSGTGTTGYVSPLQHRPACLHCSRHRISPPQLVGYNLYNLLYRLQGPRLFSRCPPHQQSFSRLQHHPKPPFSRTQCSRPLQIHRDWYLHLLLAHRC